MTCLIRRFWDGHSGDSDSIQALNRISIEATQKGQHDQKRKYGSG